MPKTYRRFDPDKAEEMVGGGGFMSGFELDPNDLGEVDETNPDLVNEVRELRAELKDLVKDRGGIGNGW